MREETEWVELVENGFNRLVGTNQDQAMSAVISFQSENLNFDLPLYGDGQASCKILRAMKKLKC